MMERRLALALAAGLALPAALSFTGLVEPQVAVARPSERTERVGIEDAILGAWEGEGTLFGRPARFEMVWAPVLGEAFLGLDYRIEGDVAMEARGFYRMAEGGAVHGTWIDSRGEILALRGLASDSTLEIEWTSPTETGRTAYRLVSDGRLEATDSVRGSEGWRPFGRAVYRRRGTPWHIDARAGAVTPYWVEARAVEHESIQGLESMRVDVAWANLETGVVTSEPGPDRPGGAYWIAASGRDGPPVPRYKNSTFEVLLTPDGEGGGG